MDGQWFRTGDVLRVDDDGWAHVVDRVKDMYISGGENVYPAEVEAVAVQLDAVANCAVVGVADRRWGEVGAAYVQVREGAALTEAELRAHLQANLARYKVPRYIEFVPELPRNATGKIRRVELRAPRCGRASQPLDRRRQGRGGAAAGGSVMTSAAEQHDERIRTDRVEALLPPSLQVERHGADGEVAVLRLARAAKRNALDDPTVLGIEAFFTAPPAGVRAVVLDAEGEHFCAGLDLSELTERDAFEGLQHSRMWHRAFERIESGRLPVVAVLKGAVIGGGLELASATHLRVAEPSTFYALPEGQHGLFVGGGGSVRVPRLIGAHRMADMMLTGRVARRRGGPGARAVALPGRAGGGPRQGAGAGREDRRRTRRSPTSRCCRRCRGSPRPTRPRATCWSR